MGVYRRKAQYHETDQMGIIIIQLCEMDGRGPYRFHEGVGFGYGEVEKRGIVSPVAGVSVSYKKPVLLMM